MLERIVEESEPVVDFLENAKDLTVVTHYDADGLASAGIMSKALDRIRKPHRIVPTKQLNEERAKEIKKMGEEVIVLDMGSGQVPVLENNFNKFAICDHHETLHETDKPHLNAHLFDIDGNKEISGAGVTYAAAKAMSKENKDLAAIAIVGAVGDMQETDGQVIGTNRDIIKDGKENNVLTVKNDIKLYGRHTRPLAQFLSYSSDPFLPGLTGDEANCYSFLEKIGLPTGSDVYYVDLDREQQKKLISELVTYGLSHGVPDFLLQNMVGEVYELKQERNKTVIKDCKGFSTLLNACGRHKKGKIGIEVCKGNREEEYEKAKNLLKMHRRLLREGMQWAQNNGVNEKENFQVLDAGENIKETLIGIVAGMLYGTKTINNSKPIVALAINKEGNYKASARATWTLVRKGLDLGEALEECAQKFDGEGGGHTIAAGARIPRAKKEQFLKAFDKKVGEQLS